MVDGFNAILIFAGADEDEVFDHLHALELLKDELLLTVIQLLVFERHTCLQFQHIEVLTCIEIDVNHRVYPEGLGVW